MSTCQFPNRCITEAVSASSLAFCALEPELELEAAGMASAQAGAVPVKVAATAFFTQVATLACCSVVSIHLKVWKTLGAMAACI